MLMSARDADIAERIETTSNVSLLTPEICEGLVRGGLDYIRVSVYSPIQEKHEKITGSDIKTERIYRHLQTLRETKLRLSSPIPYVAVKMLDTYGEENEVFRAMYQDVADELYIERPHNWIAGEKDFLGALYGESSEDLKKDLREQANGRSACGMSFYTLSVRNGGDISPCCVDWSGGTNIGNIAETTLKEAWQGESMRAFWKMQLLNENDRNPSCKNCDVYKSNYYAKDDVDGTPVERLIMTAQSV
jgi:radical SAM protein with 4Fe4S-binding SPASM domain